MRVRRWMLGNPIQSELAFDLTMVQEKGTGDNRNTECSTAEQSIRNQCSLQREKTKLMLVVFEGDINPIQFPLIKQLIPSQHKGCQLLYKTYRQDKFKAYAKVSPEVEYNCASLWFFPQIQLPNQ